MSAITPPIFFPRRWPKNRLPHFPARASSLPEIVSDQVSGDGAWMNVRFSRALPTGGPRAPRQDRWQCSFHPGSFAMRCTVPVPIPSDLTTLKIPTPFASCLRTLRSVALTDARLGGRSDQAAITERLLSISGEDEPQAHRCVDRPLADALRDPDQRTAAHLRHVRRPG